MLKSTHLGLSHACTYFKPKIKLYNSSASAGEEGGGVFLYLFINIFYSKRKYIFEHHFLQVILVT